MHKVRVRHHQNLGLPQLPFIVRRKDGLVPLNLLSIISLNIPFLGYLLYEISYINSLVKFLEFDLRMDSPNFGYVPLIIVRLFVVTNPLHTQGPNNITHNTSHTTHPTVNLHSVYTQIVFLMNMYRKRLRVSMHTAPVDAVVLGFGRILEARVPLPPSPQRN